jgi:hypothetical protein
MPEYKMKEAAVDKKEEKRFLPREAYEFMTENRVTTCSYPVWIQYVAALILEKPAMEFRLHVIYHPRHLENGDSNKQNLMVVKIKTKDIADEIQRLNEDGSFEELRLTPLEIPKPTEGS